MGSTTWVTSDFSSKLLSSLSSSMFHSLMLLLEPDKSPSPISLSHHSPSTLPFSSMMNLEKCGLDKVWSEKQVDSSSRAGLSRTPTIENSGPIIELNPSLISLLQY